MHKPSAKGQATPGVEAGAGASAEDVLESIHRVMHRFRAGQYRALKDAGHELTHMDAKVLGFFARHPGATQKDLVAHAGRDKGQMARLIAGLKERGLLEAQPDEQDRRSIRLAPTVSGRRIHQALARQSRKLAESALLRLSADERAQLCALLERVDTGLGDADRDTSTPA